MSQNALLEPAPVVEKRTLDGASPLVPPAEEELVSLDGILDTEKLKADLDAIAQKYRDGECSEPRPKVLERLKIAVTEGRNAVQELLFADNLGTLCARRLAALQDALIRTIHDFALAHVFADSELTTDERIAVLAVGGYGRGTLAPGSDIDLLFLMPSKNSAIGEKIAEYLLYFLWDLGFTVGHASRTVDECIALAKDDFTIRTSILERWLIVGQADVAAELDRRFDREVVQGTSREFIAAKLAERDQRHSKSGNTRYLVEPNVKEGKGGLRDLNTLFWIAKYHYRVDTSEALVKAGVFSRREQALFTKAEDFLWAVRCHMHFEMGKAEERLSFDLQPTIAERLGYNIHPGLQAVERFMKHYFLIAKDVGDLTRIFCAALEEEEAKEAPGLRGFVRSLRNRAKSIAGTLDFHVDNNRINIVSRDVFKRDPVNIIRIFRLAAMHDLEYHPDALKLIRRSLRLLNKDLRENPQANSLFLDVLTDRKNPALHLRRMNEVGVLGRFVPEFGKIVAMMQFNMYHHYTVDEHLLRSVAELSRIERGELGDELPLSTEIVPKLRDRRLLYVALFLHDIAKGRPEDHSIAGARVARELCPRFGLDSRETELVAWLVEDHLVMSMTAQQRDLADRKTIIDFAERVRTLERLKLLAVVTVCDIRAVGPGVWNGWKGQLLRTLYLETEPTLSGGFTQTSREERLIAARRRLAGRLSEWNEEDRDAYLELHYPNYFLTVPIDEQVADAEFIRRAGDNQPLATEVTTDAFRQVTRIKVLAPDHPRLVSQLAGACAGAKANIADSQIFTLTDGRALDVMTISRAFENEEDEMRRARRICENIEKLLRGETIMSRLIGQSRGTRRADLFEVKPKITVDNSLSNRVTVIEVEGLDRTGLLADITGAISDLSLDIRSAHISTYGEKIIDAFYVTDLIGAKVTSEAKIARIERRLQSVLESAEGEVSSVNAMPSQSAFGFHYK
ncbi:PII uridylyl-transferase [Fulvimarina pelagi HTCC2506]|uniref:Bifunctional uridylyltransferase/uridylyl-removing enzyme n=2 Tax=Fulvimarina pelagi TaxID=217511 RepID=Q0FZC4_9HYPH|nr:[protein-PII] uridylyltransferase [Fulvimarina pelagi]EAU40354.1 PII uridylyl-transferase [Fulvimarina pelagi HTCC2506]BAT31391.1 PII uridylyl-transferase [Fulvimarina pelagi]